MNQWLTPRKAEEFNQISADLRWHLPYGHFDKRIYQEIHQQWQKHLTFILLSAPYQHFGLYCVMYKDMFTFIWWITRVNGLYNQTKTIERHHKHGHLASHAIWLRENQANIIVTQHTFRNAFYVTVAVTCFVVIVCVDRFAVHEEEQNVLLILYITDLVLSLVNLLCIFALSLCFSLQ